MFLLEKPFTSEEGEQPRELLVSPLTRAEQEMLITSQFVQAERERRLAAGEPAEVTMAEIVEFELVAFGRRVKTAVDDEMQNLSEAID